MRGLRIGRIAGVDITLDASWIFIALLVGLSLFAEFTVADDGGSSSVLRWTLAIVGTALFFGSVLAHELSHAMVARRRGIAVRRIRLFIFGGVAEIEREATRPQDELAITIAGPFSSIVLGGLFYLANAAGPQLHGAPSRLLPLLGFVNLALGVFNLAPGFPLDGGRILRSVVWKATGSYRRATQIAAGAGQAVAAALTVAGAWLLLARGYAAGLWYMAIGWFLFQAARSSATFGLARDTVAGHTAGEVMSRVTTYASAATPLTRIYDDHILPGHQPCVPITVEGRVRGFVDLDGMEDHPRSEWDRLSAGQVMVRLQPDAVVSADQDMGEVLDRMVGRNESVAVVSDGRLVGVLTAEGVAAWIDARERVSEPESAP